MDHISKYTKTLIIIVNKKSYNKEILKHPPKKLLGNKRNQNCALNYLANSILYSRFWNVTN